ncbi:Probable LRR receptor-like serine/threonine-protein kinase At3g47570 [Linum grandiflorum]
MFLNPAASKSFRAECQVLRTVRHRNLVKLLTACSGVDGAGNEFKALVYEFMGNGSLEEWLYYPDQEGSTPRRLSLVQRLNIAIDVASALESGPILVVVPCPAALESGPIFFFILETI